LTGTTGITGPTGPLSTVTYVLGTTGSGGTVAESTATCPGSSQAVGGGSIGTPTNWGVHESTVTPLPPAKGTGWKIVVERFTGILVGGSVESFVICVQ
jgi:hypothetical protein